MKKPSREKLTQNVSELENQSSSQSRPETERSYDQPSLRDQNIRLVKKSIELSDLRRELEDKNYELELTRAELRRENIDLIKKSIELSDIMRELEDKNYDLKLSRAELEKALRALRQSEEKYRTLTENIRVGIYRTTPGPRGRFVEANPALIKMFGYEDRNDFLAVAVCDLYANPDDRNVISEKMLTDGFIRNEEVRLKKRDGTTFWGSSSGVTVWDSEGNAKYHDGIIEDITDRKRAEEELRQSEERFRELAELLPEIVCEINDQGLVTYVNRRGHEVTGYTQEDFDRGIRAVDLFVPEDREEATQSIDSVLRGEEIRHDEYVLQRKNGSTFHVMVRSAPIVSQGMTVGLRSIMIDMTERKRLEEQLRHAAKMEAIGQLAGGIAHDFNNLLTGILGYANMIKHNADPGSLFHDASKTIEDAAKRAGELTNQLLGFARRGKHQVVSVDLHKTIYDVVTLLSRTIDKSIRIAVELGAPAATTRGDPGQIQQMLLNLAINARDAMPDGGDLTFKTYRKCLDGDYCRAHVGSVPGDYVAVEVTDTGHGIPAEIQDRIFEPFFTTKKEGHGTGMGLATAYGIIKNHEGEIDVLSQTGSGTTFTVYVPLCREEPGCQADEENGDLLATGTGHVLVVDDEPIVRAVAADMLTTLGYRVTAQSDGHEATEYYGMHAGDVDLVIIDLIMPDMSGRECFKQLKAINPNVKAILSTGYGLEGQVQEALDEGMIGFVQKPYHLKELGRKLREILGN